MINVKPEMQNGRLEPTGLAKPGQTRGWTATGLALALQESAGWVSVRVWNCTNLCLRFKPGPLPGCPDQLLTLLIACHVGHDRDPQLSMVDK